MVVTIWVVYENKESEESYIKMIGISFWNQRLLYGNHGVLTSDFKKRIRIIYTLQS